MSSTRGSRWLAWWQLLRISNVFSAVSNVIAGHLLALSGEVAPVQLGLLVVSSVCLYSAGMVLNDCFDAELDARERPERPIPSGRVSRKRAMIFGFVLALAGLGAASGASAMIGHLQSAFTASTLLALILLYDAGAKSSMLGPWVMGSCRAVNVLLGASCYAASEIAPGIWLYAAAVGLFTVGLTFIARREVPGSCAREVYVGSALIGLALAGLVFLPVLQISPQLGWTTWIALWLVLCFWFGGRLLATVKDPTPNQVHPTVGTLIRGFILLDAASSALAAGWVAGVLVLLLLVPSRLIAVWTPPS